MGTCSSRTSSMLSRMCFMPTLSSLSLKRYICSSGSETRTDLMPTSFRSFTKISSIPFGSLIFPDSMMPGGITRSPCLPIFIPIRVSSSSTNFIDSSEISSPNDGAAKKRGIGKKWRKNLLNRLRNISLLYYITAHVHQREFPHVARATRIFLHLRSIQQGSYRYFRSRGSFAALNWRRTYTFCRPGCSGQGNILKYQKQSAVEILRQGRRKVLKVYQYLEFFLQKVFCRPQVPLS